MGEAKGWAWWATAHPQIQKNCDFSTVVLLCGTVADHPEYFPLLRPTQAGTVAPPLL
jgi:hypothetical protein